MQTLKMYYYLLLGIGLLFVSCNNKKSLPVPNIVNTSVTLSGIFIDDCAEKRGNPLDLKITLFNPISGNESIHSITINKKGQFMLELPIETNPALAIISSNIGNRILFFLVKGEENFLKLRFDKEGVKETHISNSIQWSSYNMTEGANLYMKIEETHCDESNYQFIPLYDKSYTEFIHMVYENINCRIAKVLDKDPLFSESMKEYTKQEFTLRNMNGILFYYSDNMLANFRYTNPEKQLDSYMGPPEPDRYYYHFLKDLNLNDKRNLYSTGAYNALLDNILQNETLGIQEIKDKPIDLWIKTTATVLEELVGFKQGFFYDQLAVRSYIGQLRDHTRPFTEIQKQNMKNYFKNKAILEILFGENEKIEKIAKYQGESVINQTPNVLNEQLFEKIMSKYTGKVVVLSFWGTWCGPCIETINKMRELKGEMYGKDMVFVYITNHSSHKDQWDKIIQNIGGEHYYLSEKQWNCIVNQFNFKGVPKYLILDKNGQLKNKISEYPGTDEMQRLLNELLIL